MKLGCSDFIGAFCMVMCVHVYECPDVYGYMCVSGCVHICVHLCEDLMLALDHSPPGRSQSQLTKIAPSGRQEMVLQEHGFCYQLFSSFLSYPLMKKQFSINLPGDAW